MASRLPLVDPGDPDLPPEVREIVDRYGGAENFAGLPNIMRAVANHPGAARIVAEAGAVLYGSSGTLTPAQRELAYLTASVVNSCHY
jgi:alkylhydroperoxidase family enzyme